MYFTLWRCRESELGRDVLGRESLFCTEPNPDCKGCPISQSQHSPAGERDSTWGWWHKGTRSCHEAEAHGGLTLTDLGVETEPCPRSCWNHPQGHGAFPSPRNLNLLEHSSPLLAVAQEAPETRVPIADSSHRAGCAREPSTFQCWTLGCSCSVCSPPQNKKKWLGMLQARSLCFRLFSTKRLGNKAHSFPSRESERVNSRKQNLKT